MITEDTSFLLVAMDAFNAGSNDKTNYEEIIWYGGKVGPSPGTLGTPGILWDPGDPF